MKWRISSARSWARTRSRLWAPPSRTVTRRRSSAMRLSRPPRRVAASQSYRWPRTEAETVVAGFQPEKNRLEACHHRGARLCRDHAEHVPLARLLAPDVEVV